MASLVRPLGFIARPLLFLLLGFSAITAKAQSHFSCLDGAGNIFNATIIVPGTNAPSVNGNALPTGSEIAVFAADPAFADVCVGKLTWASASGSITVWGDDDLTSARDGLRAGDPYLFRLWDSTTGLEHEIDPVDVSYQLGDGVYAHDAAVVISSLTVSAEIVGIAANNDAVSTEEDVAVDIDVLANDNAGSFTLDPSSIAVLTPPTNGVISSINPATGMIHFVPDANYSGSDSFTYVVFSGTGSDSKTATVSVDILEVNDAPTAVADAATLDEDVDAVLSILSNDTDVDDANLDHGSVTIQSPPQFGEIVYLDPATGDVTYHPAENYHGQDSFTYTVRDPKGAESKPVVVSLTVTSINDAPLASVDAAVTDEDTVIKIGVLDNDIDVDGDEIDASSVQIRTYPVNGYIKNVHPSNGNVTYVPDANFFGDDTFSYKVRDLHGKASNEVTVQVTVNGINDAPVLVEEPITSTSKGKKYGYKAKFSDAESDPLTISGRVAPSWMTVTDNGDGTADVEGTPPLNETGSFDVELFADDGNGGTLAYAYTLVVAENAAPMAASDQTTVLEDGQVLIDVLSNDVDPEGDALLASSVTIVSQPSNGTIGSIDSVTGMVSYVPAANFHGTDQFTYVVSDEIGNVSNIVQVSISVLPISDAPLAVGETIATLEDSEIIIDVLRNDSDPDGQILWISSTGTPTSGQLVVGTDGDDITYVPSENFNGTDSFTYTVVDADGNTSTATVIVVVDAVNDAPALNNVPTASLSTGTAYSYALDLADVDGDPLSVSFLAAPTWLRLTTASDGTSYLQGTPSLYDLGQHEVILMVSDGLVSIQYPFVLAVSDIGNQLTWTTELVTPAWGALEIPTDTRFTWNRIQGADEYQLQVALDNDASFSAPLFDRTFAYGASASSGDISYMVFNLPEGNTLIWRVRGHNSGGYSPWSDVGQYQTSGGSSTPTEALDELPVTTELFQNYPNPFNPRTTIAFELPSMTDVTLTIYDLMGREVATLVSSTLPAGRHDVHWDAGDRASGLYLYRLRAGSFVQSKTLTLVK